MLRLLFIGDLGSAWLFSTRRKRKAQRILACFEQALSQCSAANTNQLTSDTTHPSHGRNSLGKANQPPFIGRWKSSVISVLKLLNGSPCGSVNRGFPVSVSFGKKMEHLTYLSATLFYIWHSLATVLYLSSQILLAFP